eukprot:GFYU01029388.1.p1 GENE.GFYU01029388.1~~GFYU01029388.1.p1  ORF type:complete len:840 (-),score=261.96 GFYU01029388.1:76-2595(-)
MADIAKAATLVQHANTFFVKKAYKHAYNFAQKGLQTIREDEAATDTPEGKEVLVAGLRVMSKVLAVMQDYDSALGCLVSALDLAPTDVEAVENLTAVVDNVLYPPLLFSFLNDTDAAATAVTDTESSLRGDLDVWRCALDRMYRHVTKVTGLDSVTLLDSGSVCGVLSLLAAKPLEKTPPYRYDVVYACIEKQSLMAVLQKVADVNGLTDSITLVNVNSNYVTTMAHAEGGYISDGEDEDDVERAVLQDGPQVVVVEPLATYQNHPFNTGLTGTKSFLHTHRSAVKYLLPPSPATTTTRTPPLSTTSSGVVSPSRAQLHGALLHSQQIRQMNALDEKVAGFDLDGFNELRWKHMPVKVNEFAHEYVSDPQCFMDLNLCTDVTDASLKKGFKNDVQVQVTSDGRVDVIVFWYDFHLFNGDGNDDEGECILSTAPVNCQPRHEHKWQIAYYPSRPIPVKQGDCIHVEVKVADGGFTCSMKHTTEGSMSVMGCTNLRDGISAADAAQAKILPYHFSMLNDEERAVKYYNAVKKVVSPGKSQVVLDIGAGSGILSMMCANAGATKVRACEKVKSLATTSQRIVESLGYTKAPHDVQVLEGLSSEINADTSVPPAEGQDSTSSFFDVGEKADVVIFEIFGSDALNEGVLMSMVDAKKRLMKHTAISIPNAITVHARLAHSDTLAKLRSAPTANQSSAWGEMDLTGFNVFSPPRLGVVMRNHTVTPMSEAFDIFHVDFQGDIQETFSKEVGSIKVTRDGPINMIVYWFTLHLAEGVDLYTDPTVTYAECNDDGRYSALMREHAWMPNVYFLGPNESSTHAYTAGDHIHVSAAVTRDRTMFTAKTL